MSNVSQKISDQLYNIKDKLTDAEFKNLMDSLGELNVKENKIKKLTFTILVATLDYDYEADEEDIRKNYHITQTKYTFTSRLVPCCDNTKLCCDSKRCYHCTSGRTNANGECAFFQVLKAKTAGSVSFESLLGCCIDAFDMLYVLGQTINSKSNIPHFIKCYCDGCDKPLFAEQNIEVTNSIHLLDVKSD